MNHLSLTKQYVAEVLASICNFYWWKAGLAALMGTAAFLIGRQNYAAMMAIMALVTIDLATALIAAYRAGEAIESRKVLKSVVKLTVYGLFLSAIHLAEVVVPGTTFLDEMALSYLALTEAVSVMENVGHMGYSVPLKILNRLRELQDNQETT